MNQKGPIGSLKDLLNYHHIYKRSSIAMNQKYYVLGAALHIFLRLDVDCFEKWIFELLMILLQ